MNSNSPGKRLDKSKLVVALRCYFIKYFAIETSIDFFIMNIARQTQQMELTRCTIAVKFTSDPQIDD